MSKASHVGVRTALTRPHQRDARPLRLSSPKSVQAKKSASVVHASYSIYELSPRFSTRAYTIRDGDTLYKIAQKRGISIDTIKALNARLDLDTELLHAGDHIVLPAGKLSDRDKEILSGIGRGNNVRVYIVRKGEEIESIVTNRGIPLAEVEKLNPEVKLSELLGGEKILLPAGFYTQREKEVLSQVMPESSLMTPKAGHMSLIIPGVFIVLVAGLGFAAASSSRFKKKLAKLFKKKP